MSDEKKARFLPFHAINYFMVPEFRSRVIRSALEGVQAPEFAAHRKELDRLTSKYVQVPGFRNSVKAPVALRARSLATAFEKEPKLAAEVLSAWAAVHAGLAQQIYDILISRNWEVLPIDADRTRLPGFVTRWPEGEDYDKIHAEFAARYPEDPATEDEISLMAVWLSIRLPFDEPTAEGEADAEAA